MPGSVASLQHFGENSSGVALPNSCMLIDPLPELVVRLPAEPPAKESLEFAVRDCVRIVDEPRVISKVGRVAKCVKAVPDRREQPEQAIDLLAFRRLDFSLESLSPFFELGI